MNNEPNLDDPMLSNDLNCCKKHMKTIIFALIGIVVIAGIIILVVLLTKKDSNTDEGNKPVDKKYDYGLDMDELKKRTDPDNMRIFVLLDPNSTQYTSLEQGDKDALKYLVKAGAILEDIQLRIDEHNNIPFRNFLEEEIKKGNEKANLTKIIFDGQKGINSVDILTNKVNLAKGITAKPGCGVYPEDITKEELHKILITMLKENKIEEVKKILNQRSIVERDGEYLKATDYVDYFKNDFSKIADLLDKASEVSTNADFNDYLKKQAKALRQADPLLDAYADIKWAELQDTPLELTITRENYRDELTGSFIDNKELVQLLKDNNIFPVSKDYLGFRVGIINKEGTDALLSIKNYLPLMAENMPYHEKYNQSISGNETIKQTMVDADLIMLAGDVGAYRAGITLAENLPNDDKLSLSMGGGRRNVYHRQVRKERSGNPEKRQKILDSVLDKEQHKYYDDEANHWFVICHENTHSLGPRITDDHLGEYSHIIEENKADMGGLIFLDLLKNEGYYDEEKKNKIIVTFIVDSFMNTKPDLSQPHWVRSVMQNYYQFINGGYEITDDKIHVNIDKVVSIAQSMMEKIIDIQLNNTLDYAKEYVNEYFKWTDEMELIANKKANISNPVLNAKIINELAESLIKEN